MQRLRHARVGRVCRGRAALLVAIAVLGLAAQAAAAYAAPLASGAATRLSAQSGPQAVSAAAKPLAGKIIGIDPGHNGRNWTDPARVVLTRKNNHGLGPCVNKRAYILDRAHASVSIDIHADYGPSSGHDVHLAFLRHTPMKVSSYYGHDGYIFGNDLAGLNLTTMPKVLIECGNMNNAADARLLTRARVQEEIARALVAAIIRFLSGH